ncbi:cell wall-binding repeat-containing protein [Peptostreptococcus canis]|uniref:L,D-transpeptidase family protein n=1 Tax=Peptostreptococcus canis TaxID=1159213 RepID=A0ABR6TKD4_9FIRM|nr:cell wall-binding repeat-containing protein [Peptostreptococcus canis]MBC2575872.1 L,D-transpeptidase family protein [Peptostreptococcus canis]MBP1998008.1 putative cell wall-binding protein/lipoprotein-anchoring transpeptidase ErfK/SrfK [Peptostreptococcus canis]
MKKNIKRTILTVAVMTLFLSLGSSMSNAINRDLSGTDRFSTAISISKSGWSNGSEIVMLVNSRAVSDSLAVAPLAKKLQSPVLLTNSEVINSNTKEEIVRLKAKKIIIIGGKSSVSSSIEDNLRNEGYEVERITGSSRVETSINIGRKISKINGKPFSEIFIVNGKTGLADAAGAGAIAAKRDAAIIFADNNSFQLVQQELSSINNGIEYLIGGISNIPVEYEKIGSNVERISGKDRQETNYKLIRKFYSEFNSVYIADDGNKNPSRLIDSVLINAGIIASQNNTNNIDNTENTTTISEVSDDGVATENLSADNNASKPLVDGPVVLVNENKGYTFDQLDLINGSSSTVNEIVQVSGGEKFAKLREIMATFIENRNNQAVNDNYNKLMSYRNMQVEYNLGNRKVLLNSDRIMPMVIIKNDAVNTIDVNRNSVRNFVSSLNPSGITQSSNESYAYWKNNNVIITSSSTLKLDINKETENLIRIIKEAKSVYGITPRYIKVELPKNGKKIGSKYIVVNISQQNMKLWDNGKVVLSTPIVSGNPNKGYATPPGIFKINYKMRNKVLRGPGYASPVKYWMPFNGAIGIHDSSWQPAYGGNRYLYAGSHGCINTPLKSVARLYNMVSAGTPVIVVRR